MSDQPAYCVPRNVKLWNHANATFTRVREQLSNLMLGVILAVRGEFLEFGSVPAFHAKPFIIGKMEMERVEFHCCHAIDVALDDFKRDEVPRDINHQSAPRKPRAIFHANGRNDPAMLIFLDQLK